MLRDQARPEALTRLQRTLLLGEVAKRESIAVDADAVQAKVAEMMEEYAGQDVDENRLQEVVEEDLLRDKILDWLETNNSIELVPEGSLQPEEIEPTEPETEAEAAVVEPVAEPEVDAASETIEVQAETVAETEASETIEVQAETVAETEASEAQEPVKEPEAKPAKAKTSKKKTTKPSA